MHVRKAHVAGSFYDENKESLAKYVQHSLTIAQQERSAKHVQDVHMVLLPHAGHYFCGHVMASTLATVRLPQKLILLGPNHTGHGQATSGLSVWHEGVWQSPLGDIPIDHDLAQELLQSNVGFEADPAAHMQEHSLEVILPFLQEFVPNFHMVPICVRNNNLHHLQRAGLILASIIHERSKKGEDIALVLSSDMHHFSSHERTLELDDLALKALINLDPIELYQNVIQHNISMCGIFPAIMAIFACKALGAKKCNLVSHTTSYEKSRNSQRTVGYAGLYVPKNTCKKS